MIFRRKIFGAGLVAMLSGPLPAGVAAPPPPDLQAHLPAADDARAIRFANGVIMLPDIPYQVIPGYRPLRLDLYLPSARRPDRKLPLVMWIHGGAFELGDLRTEMSWSDWPQVLADLSARGYAVAAVSYRLSAEAKFPAQTDDLRAALTFLAKQSDRWALDTRHVFTWGGSAGGHLALMTGLGDAPERAPYRIAGIVDWYGPSDLAKTYVDRSNSPEARLLGCANQHCSAEALRAASPINIVRREEPPLLIQHGGADSIVSVEQSQGLKAAVDAAGAKATLITYPGLDHGFWGGDAATLKAILNRTFGFFDAHAHD